MEPNMRRFHSYGPINNKLHYYAPRKELIHQTFNRLTGKDPDEGGHYITVWAPRQTGKTWIMQEVTKKIKQTGQYEIGIITMERAKGVTEEKEILSIWLEKLSEVFEKSLPPIQKIRDIPLVFKKQYFDKPVILVMDEFDALVEEFINRFASIFRDIFTSRTNERDKPDNNKTYLLHGLALIGVRSVLGIENITGSPFNIQRSIHIPNLTIGEIKELFQEYEKESGQHVKPAVIDRLYNETNGQPGLTCWFGELLTEGFEHYTNDKNQPIQAKHFETVYRFATSTLPNNNILNIIDKANTEPFRKTVLKLFKTDKPIKFRFDKDDINFLYMNGVIEPQVIPGNDNYVKFASSFVQKRLFNFFSSELFDELGELFESDLDTEANPVITPKGIDIPRLLELYQRYLDTNKNWLFQKAPRRSDNRLYEAVYHFNLYAYLDEFFLGEDVRIYPEFPTGNGKIDLFIEYQGITYGIEVKSFSHRAAYHHALDKAAQYAGQLKLKDIYLVSFIESINETTRKKYETSYTDSEAGVTVHPVFIQTGKP